VTTLAKRVAIVAAALMAWLPGAAQAGSDGTVGGVHWVPATGPGLWNGQLIWGDRLADGSFDLRTADPSAAPLYRSGVAPFPYNIRTADMATSGNRVLLDLIDLNPGCTGKCPDPAALPGGVVIGTTGAAFTQFGTCGSSEVLALTADISSDFAVMPPSQCGSYPQKYEVRDLATGTTKSLPGGIYRAHIAGHYVAWEQFPTDSSGGGREYVVWDLQTDKELYKVALPGSLSSVDLQADGKVAFSYQSSSPTALPRDHVAWASPAEPRAHDVGAEDGFWQVKLQDDVIAFLRGSAYLPSVATAPAEVGTLTLAGQERVASDRASATSGSEWLDFDGAHLAWLEVACDSVLVHERSLTESPLLGRGPGACPLVLKGSPRVRRRRLEMTVDCTGFGATCSSHVTVRAKAKVGGRTRSEVLARGGFSDSHIAMRLRRPSSAFRGRRVRAEVSDYVTGANGRAERRSVPVTFRIPR